MADNVLIDPGATPSVPVGTDDVGGFHYQRIKIDGGGDGLSVPIVAGQQLAAASIPVVVASDQSAVPVSAAALPLPSGAATAAAQATLETDVEGINTRLGEVQASPTSNTVLDRLKTIATSLASILAKVASFGTAGTPSADVVSVQGVASGTVLPVSDGGGSLTVDGTVAVSGHVPGTGATSLGKAEDAVAGDGDTGVMMLGVRKDTPATTVSADGDYTPPIFDANGLLWVNPGTVTLAALPAGTNAIGKLAANSGVDIGDVDVTSVPSDPFGANADAASATGSISAKLRFIASTGIPVTGTVTVGTHAVTQSGAWTVTASNASGDVAHDAADSGNPIKVGVQARQTNPTAVADADRVNLTADDLGRLLVRTAARDLVTRNRITLSTTTETTLLAAVASTFLDVTKIVITNSSATAVTVTIRDTTTGSAVLIVAIAANGGAVLDFDVPLKQTTVNTNWTAQLSGAVSSVEIFAQAIKEV